MTDPTRALKPYLMHWPICMLVTRPGCRRCTCGLVLAVTAAGLRIAESSLYGATFLPQPVFGKPVPWTDEDELRLRELQRGE